MLIYEIQNAANIVLRQIVNIDLRIIGQLLTIKRSELYLFESGSRHLRLLFRVVLQELITLT